MKPATFLLLVVALLAGGAHCAKKDDSAKKIEDAIAVMQDSLINADWTGYGDSDLGTFTLSFNTTADLANEVMDVLFGGVTQSAGEVGDPMIAGDTYRDTLVQIKNDREDTITVHIGISDVAAVDPGFQVPHFLATGETVSKQNWNSYTSYDVIATVNAGSADQVRIEVGNPKVGYPYVKVCGDSNKFYQEEVHDFNCNGVAIRATRNNDLKEAISWSIEVM